MKKIKLTIIGLLGLTVSFAGAGQVYTTYTGSQNGVTIRDSSTFSQLNYFNPGFLVDNIASGNGNELYLTSGNGLYRYNTAGSQLAQLIFPDPGISYNGISMAVSGNSIYSAYTGTQNGITVRDATTLAQTTLFDPGFAVDNLTAGNGNELYLTSGNGLYRYNTAGSQLAQLIFPDPGISYNGISMAVSGNSIYSAYTGTQNGITVRDANTLAQSFFFNPGFVVDNVTAGDNNDMFLTSGNSLYHYSSAGTQLNSFTFPDAGIVYQGIAFAIPEPASAGLLVLMGGGIYFGRRFFSV